MKPVKNRYFCEECGHTKMLFSSCKEAKRFLHFNADEIEIETGKRPVRAYYCKSCEGWHVTSRTNSFSMNDLVRRFGNEKGRKMYDTVKNTIGFGKSISGGLRRKVKELRHNLNYETINISKCQEMIISLIDVFEVVIEAKLENKATIDCLFNKFSLLCSVFTHKKQLAIASL